MPERSVLQTTMPERSALQTTIRLADGTKFVVQESVEQIASAFRSFPVAEFIDYKGRSVLISKYQFSHAHPYRN